MLCLVKYTELEIDMNEDRTCEAFEKASEAIFKAINDGYDRFFELLLARLEDKLNGE